MADGSPMLRYTIIFRGRVQGVGFRFTAQRVAERHAVSGWVRNEPDGTVRCVAEGEPAELDRFVAAVQKAMAANLDATDIAKEPAAGEPAGFSIRYT